MTILSNPQLFLFVIGSAIVWQIINSKALAKASGQGNTQATMFSFIVAVSIFLCVANGVILYAVLGAIVECGINILLVLRKYQGLRKNSPERSRLNIWTDVFIGVLIPTFILVVSELYIRLA